MSGAPSTRRRPRRRRRRHSKKQAKSTERATLLCSAVDERACALTRRRRLPKPFTRDRQECPMATAAAVKDEQTAHRFAKDQLKAFVERVERLEEEKKT